jgi:hypothetical protein
MNRHHPDLRSGAGGPRLTAGPASANAANAADPASEKGVVPC